MIDYRTFRFSKLNTPEFSHLKLLLFWPIYGLAFLSLERFIQLDYHTIYTSFDDKIPFCEYFLLAYLFWFVFLIGMHLYLLLFDVEGFRKFMWFTIITYSVTCLIYIIYPSQQELRPTEFLRDNVMTRFMAWFYDFDTNTNVCPSLHVIGSMAVLFAAWHTPRFANAPGRIAFTLMATLISISTVFLKQHSLLDIPPALLISFLVYFIVYRWWPAHKKKKTGSEKS